MEATVTPAGQAILRIEREELPALRNSLREALMILEALRQLSDTPPAPLEGFDLERDTDQIELLQNALERAVEAAL